MNKLPCAIGKIFVPVFIVLCGLLLDGKQLMAQTAPDLFDLPLEDLLNIKVSTAAKYEQSVSDAPAAISIITAEDFARYGYRTLDEALQSVPGLYRTYDRNYTYLGVRGFSRLSDFNVRILMLINGHTMNENIWGSVGIGTELSLNLESIERVEIVHGPGSTLYGTSAMFAVVNVITKTNTEAAGISATVNGGSFGRQEAFGRWSGGRGEKTRWTFAGIFSQLDGQDLYYPEYDSPETNNGLAKDLDKNENFGGTVNVTHGALSMQGVWTERLKRIPTGAYSTIFNGRPNDVEDKHRSLELKYEKALGAKNNLSLRSYFDRYDYNGNYPYDYGDGAVTVNSDRSHGQWFGAEARLHREFDQLPLHITVGGEYQSHTIVYRNFDEGFEAEPYTAVDRDFYITSGYLEAQYRPTEMLTVTGGLRRDKYSIAGSSTSPRIAIIYKKQDDGAVKLLYGEAFRAPSFHQQFISSLKSADLKSEKIQTTELVWEQKVNANLWATASFYINQTTGLITTAQNAEGAEVFVNADEITARGMEIELNGRWSSGLWFNASYANQASEDKEAEDGEVVNSPKHLLKGRVSVSNRFGVAGLEVFYDSSRLNLVGSSTDDFALVNLNLTSRAFFNDRLKVGIYAHNLFDTVYKFPVGSEQTPITSLEQDGREVNIKITTQF